MPDYSPLVSPLGSHEPRFGCTGDFQGFPSLGWVFEVCTASVDALQVPMSPGGWCFTHGLMDYDWISKFNPLTLEFLLMFFCLFIFLFLFFSLTKDFF